MSVFSISVAVFSAAASLVLVILAVAVLKSKSTEEKKLLSVTRFLFVTTQVAALGWITISYVIAGYATIYLSQPFPVVELSQEIAKIILGQGVLKMVSNMFEHNNGGIFGTSDGNKIEGDY